MPVLRIGDRVLYDSTETDVDGLSMGRHFCSLTRRQKRAEEIEAWVDEQFIRALPTVIYGSWGTPRAARTIGRAGNFSAFGGMGVKLGGPLIMRMVAGRILEGRVTDGRAWIAECLDQFEQWLGDWLLSAAMP